MLVNTTWLLEYLEPACSVDELVKAMPNSGLEVEEFHPLAEALAGVRIGFIRDKAPLPGAEGMFVCQVEVGGGRTVQIVCASEHPVEVGWGVPVALAETKLPTGIPIKHERFHGAMSEGMICLDGELGLVARGSGLQVFDDESALGRRLVDLVDVRDVIIDLKVTPNRPFCLGLIGLARELAATLGLSVRIPAVSLEESGPAIEDVVTVEIKEHGLCPRYTCRLIRGVRVTKSPHWLRSRLLSTGSNPINNVVDVTNFVLREWGHPLHAFDHGKLAGSGIVVRKMGRSERIELLDGTSVDGETGPLVIADLERPVALAGIMGGKDSGVTSDTTDVLLEAAYFDPVDVRRSSKALGIMTDASYRFERGMDPNGTLEGALDRAAALIAEVGGGEVARGIIDAYPSRIEPRRFRLTSARVSSYLGTSVSDETVQKSLQKLGMKCSDELEVEVPTYRVDVNDPVVLIEDVARITGYDQIPLTPPVGRATGGGRNLADALRRKALLFLSSNGFLESRNVPMESPEQASLFNRGMKGTIRLANPMNVDMSVMKTSLLSGLLKTISRNARRDAETFRYFEIDRVFNKSDASTGRWSIAAAGGGPLRDVDWAGGGAKFDFYYMKGLLENLLETAGVMGVTFRPADAEGFDGGRSAEVFADGASLGVIGAVKKEILSEERIKEPIFAFELDVDRMLAASSAAQKYEPFPRTPAVTRDLAVVVKSDIPYSRLEQSIKRTAGTYLENVRCVDVYEGKHVPAGFRSVAIRLRFRAAEKTLSSDEVTLVVDGVVAQLEQEFGARLRA
ncbi:MAG: phenylalanine--tRNA ligase subunit beta [Blastocatellia bacterium]